MALVVRPTSVVVCKIIKYELPKCYNFEYLTFKWKVKVMKQNVANYYISR